MLNLFKRGLPLALLLPLLGCEEQADVIPSYEVTAQSLQVDMRAQGEVEAAVAQRIMSPGRQPMTIEWLAPEHSMVKKGDVIARFDGEQLLKDSRNEELEMRMIEQDIAQSVAQQSRQVSEIQSEQQFVDHEFQFVDRFAIDDVRVYSQLEIIETLQNRDYLLAKDEFLDWKGDSVIEQNDSEKAVLDIRRQGHAVKFQRHQDALSKLLVYAPNDGLLTYERDRRGEKPSVGQTVFPGRPIATIPNLEKMQARVFVLSRDAIGLRQDLSVTLVLNAFPDRALTGKVIEVGGFPRSIERGSPITYYEVVVSFDEQVPELLQPGRKLSATISNGLATETLLVPLQALEHDLEASYVYVKHGDEWQQRTVVTGEKNLFFVEVTEGLKQGDIVALSHPEVQG